MHPTSDPVSPSPPPLPDTPTDWHQLPARGRWIAIVGGAATMAVTVALGSIAMLVLFRAGRLWWLPLAAGVLAALLGGWAAGKRYRHTRWRLDAHGLAVQRGRWWQSETRVPITRVQHLDLRRGPIERMAGLTTLVVHTAGTRLNAVAIGGLDHHDAERLRDRLARQLDHDDDAL